MRSLIGSLFSGILLIVIAVLLATFYFLGTSSGSRYLLTFVPHLETEQVEGSVLSGLSIANLRYDDTEQQLHIEKLQIVLDLSALTSRRFTIEKIRAEKIQ